ncbi:MAG: hypothetical protein EZS28_041853 [Streblomastix strix]|uniref:Uncharacterized protein n=1 Tax=Streblomastix strix TaxID=222440 RepID=A0A5J4TX31_9EUKA|nr:MAG: hypothetical protein EZS28_041853 [Streblomastix strix]
MSVCGSKLQCPIRDVRIMHEQESGKEVIILESGLLLGGAALFILCFISYFKTLTSQDSRSTEFVAFLLLTSTGGGKHARCMQDSYAVAGITTIIRGQAIEGWSDVGQANVRFLSALALADFNTVTADTQDEISLTYVIVLTMPSIKQNVPPYLNKSALLTILFLDISDVSPSKQY